MRIWSLAPEHLDRQGLIACWRETLLAQAVLAERTKGYRNHPQLERFRAQEHPLAAVGAYLSGLADEATARGYRFDRSRILLDPASQPDARPVPSITVTTGQLEYEWEHLGRKLRERSPADAVRWAEGSPTPHALFMPIPGELESWERP